MGLRGCGNIGFWDDFDKREWRFVRIGWDHLRIFLNKKMIKVCVIG